METWCYTSTSNISNQVFYVKRLYIIGFGHRGKRQPKEPAVMPQNEIGKRN